MPGDVLVLEQVVWGSASSVPSPDLPSLLSPTALGQDEHLAAHTAAQPLPLMLTGQFVS